MALGLARQGWQRRRDALGRLLSKSSSAEILAAALRDRKISPCFGLHS